jgi:hypothetical protein
LLITYLNFRYDTTCTCLCICWDAWHEYIFRILSPQDGNTKQKQCRASQINLLPKAISSSHLFLSVENKTLQNISHSFSHLYSFPRRAQRHTAAQIPSFQVTSHLQQKAIRNQKAYHLLGCCLRAQTLVSSVRNHSNNPVIGMFTDSSFPLLSNHPTRTQCSSTNPFSSKCTDWLVQPASYSFC